MRFKSASNVAMQYSGSSFSARFGNKVLSDTNSSKNKKLGCITASHQWTALPSTSDKPLSTSCRLVMLPANRLIAANIARPPPSSSTVTVYGNRLNSARFGSTIRHSDQYWSGPYGTTRNNWEIIPVVLPLRVLPAQIIDPDVVKSMVVRLSISSLVMGEESIFSSDENTSL